MSITEEIKRYIESNMVTFDDELELSYDVDIFKNGFVNSLFAMKLISFVEKEYEIQVENDELNLENFSSINQIVEFINTKKSC
ncbi:MAG: acyl carrier protein [bacterium]|nr:acyl carrier protein [bacterium]